MIRPATMHEIQVDKYCIRIFSQRLHARSGLVSEFLQLVAKSRPRNDLRDLASAVPNLAFVA